MRARFAASLARIDGPAALGLIEGFPEDPPPDFYRAGVARGLADHDAAAAERLVEAIKFMRTRFMFCLAVFHRMAAGDPGRAARLALRFPEPGQQAYALGMTAHGLAATDRNEAARLLDEAYGILERAHRQGRPGGDNQYDVAVTAAALVPVAETIDPGLIEDYFWRAMALRAPRAARIGPTWVDELHFAQFAPLIARYDRTAARDMIEALAGRWRQLAAEGESNARLGTEIFMAPAVIDARWACDLVQSLPDAPVPPTQNPKLLAARWVAQCLAMPSGDLSPAVYFSCGLRDPNMYDVEW